MAQIVHACFNPKRHDDPGPGHHIGGAGRPKTLPALWHAWPTCLSKLLTNRQTATPSKPEDDPLMHQHRPSNLIVYGDEAAMVTNVDAVRIKTLPRSRRDSWTSR